MTNDRASDDFACIEFVELITAYLDDAVTDDQRRRIEEHLDVCEGCRAALQQWQMVIRVTGRLTSADVARTDPLIRERLESTLRRPRRR